MSSNKKEAKNYKYFDGEKLVPLDHAINKAFEESLIILVKRINENLNNIVELNNIDLNDEICKIKIINNLEIINKYKEVYQEAVDITTKVQNENAAKRKIMMPNLLRRN